MGPGPDNVNFRVYQAMETPVIGCLDLLLLEKYRGGQEGLSPYGSCLVHECLWIEIIC